MKKIIGLLSLILVLTGCSKVQEQIDSQAGVDTTTNDSLGDDYYRIIKFDINKDRENYYSYIQRDTIDFQSIGRGLQELSMPHFSTDTHYMTEGQFLTRDDRNELLGRSSEYALQPEKGRVIDGVESAEMISVIYELDFYTQTSDKNDVVGLSIGIVISPESDGGNQLSKPMRDSDIESYGREIIPKMYSFLQTKEELEGIPINICVYQSSDQIDSFTNGRFILSAYCDGSVGSIEKVDFQTIIFTSNEAEEKDIATASEFAQFKSTMKNFSIEAIGVTGKGQYRNGKIQSMKITLKTNVKTYAELQMIVSKAADELNSTFSSDFDITVEVVSQDAIDAIIIKESGQSSRSYMLN